MTGALVDGTGAAVVIGALVDDTGAAVVTGALVDGTGATVVTAALVVGGGFVGGEVETEQLPSPVSKYKKSNSATTLTCFFG